MNNTKQLKQLINSSKKIVFLTGAGMSTESGISDFRSDNGVYQKYKNAEEILSASYYRQKPLEFWKAYKDIFSIKLMQNYKPNPGHHYITELQNSGKDVAVLTQNIDGLHTLSGTKTVYEMHGTLSTASCLECGTQYDLFHINKTDVPRCKCGLILKPDVVLFGDQVQHYEEGLNKAYESDLFIVMGSSLEVYPVNHIPQYIGRTQIPMVIINKGKTNLDFLFDICIDNKIGNVISELKKM